MLSTLHLPFGRLICLCLTDFIVPLLGQLTATHKTQTRKMIGAFLYITIKRRLRNNILPVKLRFKLKRIQRTRPYSDPEKAKRQIFHRVNVYYDAAFGCLSKKFNFLNPCNNVLYNYFEINDHPYPIQRIRFLLTLFATS